MRKMCSSRTVAAGALLALTAGSLAGCAEDETEDGVFHCAAEINGVERVVDCDDVNDTSGTVFYGGGFYPVFIDSRPYYGGSAYAPGAALPANEKRNRIGYKDAAGRQRFGLPASGRVSNGTVKTGVLGKGGGAAPAKAGSGGVGGKSGSGGS